MIFARQIPPKTALPNEPFYVYLRSAQLGYFGSSSNWFLEISSFLDKTKTIKFLQGANCYLQTDNGAIVSAANIRLSIYGTRVSDGYTGAMQIGIPNTTTLSDYHPTWQAGFKPGFYASFNGDSTSAHTSVFAMLKLAYG